jgi:DNA-binding SARP family transcriptional activator
MVHVHLFGAFAMDWEGPIPVALGTPARHLASYLFSFPNEPHRREKILELFWRESDAEQARKGISMALWRFGKLLSRQRPSEITLRANRREVCLDLHDTNVVDVHRFRTATLNAFSADRQVIDFEALGRAVNLYTGPFLEEYDEDWVLDQRERLQSLYLRALTLLMRKNALENRYEDAIAHGRRILSSDPMRETVQRAVMLFYVVNGRQGEAIRQFKRYEKALRDECDAAPMPKTCSLLALIRSGEIYENLPQLIEKELASSTQSFQSLSSW